MRVPTLEPRRRFRFRGWIIGAVVVLVVLLFSLRGLAGFYTDYLWFDSLGQGSTWSSLLAARVAPALVFTVVFFVIMFVNLVIADRLAPKYRSMGPEDELIARYQQVAGPYTMRIRIGVSLFFALIAGIGVSSQWKQWVLFTHYQSFHKVDPQFHKDIGFYVFQLPFLKFIAEWLFAGLVIVLIVTAVEHYLNGGIRFQSPFQRVTPQVKAHLSVILAVMALVKTAQYYLGRFELNFSTRGVVEGASATDVKAQLPALNLLIFISIGAAGLFLWNIRRRGWVLPIIAVGLWAFVSLVIGTIYPAAYQQFKVGPNEYQAEAKYIDRNIRATRDAFGLDTVKTDQFHFTSLKNGLTLDAARTLVDTNSGHHQQRPVVGPERHPRHLLDAPEPADLLPDRRRRRRPLPHRRRDPAGAHRGPRSEQRRPPEPVVRQPAHRVHARLRRGRVAEQRGTTRRRSHPSCSATSRSRKTASRWTRARRHRSTSPRT